MFLKNYTSDVPVSQTIYRIEQVLIKCGVSGIMKDYADTSGVISAITFQIRVEGQTPWTVRLPANVDRAVDALWKNYADGDELTPDGKAIAYNRRKKLRRADFVQQGERTAWKIIQDWVEVQMSMIQMQQADFREVFLPYLWDGKQTYFTHLKNRQFAGLLTNSNETDTTGKPASR